MESNHGHKLLNLVKNLEQPVSRQELLSLMDNEFGKDASFHTCSAENLKAAQILALFLEKGKLREEDGVIIFAGCQCNHH